jgi:hypothetical protein
VHSVPNKIGSVNPWFPFWELRVQLNFLVIAGFLHFWNGTGSQLDPQPGRPREGLGLTDHPTEGGRGDWRAELRLSMKNQRSMRVTNAFQSGTEVAQVFRRLILFLSLTA